VKGLLRGAGSRCREREGEHRNRTFHGDQNTLKALMRTTWVPRVPSPLTPRKP
jgi:hypothetical protein